jgi:hypothetical protein
MDKDVTVIEEFRKGRIPGKYLVCGDCGTRYKIAPWARSGLCPNCGNIDMLGSDVEPLKEQALLNPIPLLPKLRRTRSGESNVRKASPKASQSFKDPPEGKLVESILAKNQQEWQLWASVVENFGEPSFHSAYLTHTLQSGAFAMATERYKAHRGTSVLLEERSEEAAIADLMLERLSSLVAIRWHQSEARAHWLYSWYFLVPWESRPLQVCLFLLGSLGVWAGLSFLSSILFL